MFPLEVCTPQLFLPSLLLTKRFDPTSCIAIIRMGGIMPQCIRADQIISLVLIERLHYCIKHYFSSTLTTIHVCHICNLSVRLGRYYNSAKTRLRLARYMPHNYICFRFSAMAFSFLYNFSYYFAYFCFSF